MEQEKCAYCEILVYRIEMRYSHRIASLDRMDEELIMVDEKGKGIRADGGLFREHRCRGTKS